MIGNAGTVGVVGAGSMGGGIAAAFATVGLAVTLVDANEAALRRGMEQAAGNGFPSARGGPMRFAGEIGPSRIGHRLEALGRRRGNAYGYGTPSPLLAERSRVPESVQ